MIVPSSSTVATDSLFELQATDLSVASSGDTVAVNCSVSPTAKVVSFLFNETPVTGITLSFTVTVQVAVLPPSCVVTIITVVPFDTAVIVPLLTVATEGSLEFQVTD